MPSIHHLKEESIFKGQIYLVINPINLTLKRSVVRRVFVLTIVIEGLSRGEYSVPMKKKAI